MDDSERSTFAFERLAPGTDDVVVCLANLQGLHQHDYRIGLRRPGRWRGLITSDDARYGGSGSWVPHLEPEPVPWHDRPYSATITIPPLTVLYLVPDT